ncbi:unnamed protein product [Parajaminaea phylloscopi]
MRFLSFLAVSGILTGAALAAPAPNSLAPRADGEAGQLEAWCSKFNKACISTCVDNAPAGSTQKVTLACQASGSTFKFGCKCGTTDVTSKALNKAGGLKATTTTVGTSTKKTTTTTKPVVTSTTKTTKVGSETYTLSYQETTTSTSTSTEKYSTTTTSLSIVPTTWVSTIVSTVPYTSEVTVTQTSASVNGQPIATTIPFPVIEVAFAAPPMRLRVAAIKLNAASNKAVSSTKDAAVPDVFCTNFFNACSRQCGRVSSSVKTQVCKQTSTTDYSYQLGCICKNGYTETRHSLADIQEDLDITKTIATVTSTATITQPQTVVKTVTGYSTLTFLTERTDSFTTTTTTTTSTTSTSISQTTFSPGTTTTTTTYNPVSTHTATSTILQILAPTGVLNVRRAIDDVSLGYVDSNGAGSGYDTQINTLSDAKNTVDNWMLVADASGSGLYRLMSTNLAASQHAYMSCEVGSGKGDFSAGSSDYCLVEGALDSNTVAGAAAGTGSYFNNPYETYIWRPSVGTIKGRSGSQLKAYPQWTNSNGYTRPTTYLVAGGKQLMMTGNRTALAALTAGANGANPAPLYLAFETR